MSSRRRGSCGDSIQATFPPLGGDEIASGGREVKETSHGFVMLRFEIDGALKTLFGIALFFFGQERYCMHTSLRTACENNIGGF